MQVIKTLSSGFNNPLGLAIEGRFAPLMRQASTRKRYSVPMFQFFRRALQLFTRKFNVPFLVKQDFAPDGRYFQNIYKQRLFGKSTSVSGPGSSLDATKVIRESIFELFDQHGIRTIADIPCGDFLWFSAMEFKDLKYTGFDIVPELISELREVFPGQQFDIHDATSDLLESYDLILCRDLLVHLTNEQARRVIDNFKKSGSTYLLATTFVNLEGNVELRVPRIGVGWRPLNLAIFPFNLGSPIMTINENSSEGRGRYQDKSLGLWKLN